MSIYCPETSTEWQRRFFCIPDHIPDEQINRYVNAQRQVGIKHAWEDIMEHIGNRRYRNNGESI